MASDWIIVSAPAQVGEIVRIEWKALVLESVQDEGSHGHVRVQDDAPYLVCRLCWHSRCQHDRDGLRVERPTPFVEEPLSAEHGGDRAQAQRPADLVLGRALQSPPSTLTPFF
jgi:hypothetical protein